MHEEKKRMPLEELQLTEEYQKLTPKQQLWVSTYVGGGICDGRYDPISATRTAYETKTPEIARVMSYSMMANIRIVAVLNRHFGTSPIEEFLVQLERAIRNKTLTQAQIWALKLKSDILGYGSRLPGVKGVENPIDRLHREEEKAKKPPKEKKTRPEKAAKPEPPSDYGY